MSTTFAFNHPAGSREAGAQCPLCNSEISEGEPVSACRSCGTVHHQACWERSGGCGSYACAPARRNIAAVAAPTLAISSAELWSASPLPARTPSNGQPDRWVSRPVEPARLSKLAVAAFVVALIGIPVFGLVTGLVAVILGSLALVSISGTRLRGLPWAAAGVVLGLVDVVGWIVGLSIFMGGGGGHAHGPQLMDFQLDTTSFEGLPPPITRAMRGNVLIESQFGWAFGRAIGSGVILQIEDGEATIVTNRHVIDPSFAEGNFDDQADASNFTVKMIGQEAEPGRVKWIAKDGIDLALVTARCSTAEAEAAQWDRSKPLHIGEPVFAIGNPHNLSWTHTQGTISQFRIQQKATGQVRVIQTQTAINSGNSGGGLYDKDGMLIGINTWTSDKQSSEGLNFAIAAESLWSLLPAEDLHDLEAHLAQKP